MIVDFNTYVGTSWPGRPEINTEPDAVRAKLESCGVDKALTSLVEGIWFRDTMEGNRQLAELIKPHRDFFIPLACLDPSAAYSLGDLDECFGELRMAGVKLEPTYHHYQLDDLQIISFCREVGLRKAPVFVPVVREEDRFGHPALATRGDGRFWLEELMTLMTEASETCFVINMMNIKQAKSLIENVPSCRGRVFFDYVRMDKWTLDFEELISDVGPEFFVLGTNHPFFMPQAALLNVGYRALDRHVTDMILGTSYQSNPILAKTIEGTARSRKAIGTQSPADALKKLEDAVEPFRGRIIDAHAHSAAEGYPEMLEQAKRAGIGKLLVSNCLFLKEKTEESIFTASPEQIDQFNSITAEWRDLYPGLVELVAYINPKNGESSVRDVEYWVGERGAVGLKLLFPRPKGNNLDNILKVVQKAGELDAPVLFHVGFHKKSDDGGFVSPEEVAYLAENAPHAKILMGHFGGSWIRAARTIKHLPNVYGDISGTCAREGLTEYLVREAGTHKVLYGADMPCRAFGSQLTKVLFADLSMEQKEMLLSRNARNLFPRLPDAKEGN